MTKYVLLLLFPFLLSAQTHRFVYEMKYKNDSTAADFKTANMALDVNPDEVKFYNFQYITIDSLNKVRAEQSLMWNDETPVVIRKRNTNENRLYVLLDHLFTLESTDKMNWNLSSETKEQSGYLLQKATTSFGGRNWTAWFTKQIDLQEGPYKFRGLPGLIFQLSDDRNHYLFTLLKSYKLPKTYDTKAFLEGFGTMKPVTISQDRYEKLLLATYSDPLRQFRESFKENTNPDNKYFFNSIEVKDISQFKDLTEMKKKMIRTENNPIELDKAVHYPPN